MRKFVTGLIAAAGIVAMTSGAQAQMLCQERDQVLEKLSAGYKEAPIAMGLASNGALIEVLTSAEEGKTWTIIVTQPNGISCVMATGESWQDVDRLAMNTDPSS